MRFTRTDIDELGVGDIVRVRRSLYWHYGVFCGNGGIIHFTSYPNHFWNVGAEVKETSLFEFLKSSAYLEVIHASTFSPTRTLEIASGKLGERGYSIFTNNCRHFVWSCLA